MQVGTGPSSPSSTESLENLVFPLLQTHESLTSLLDHSLVIDTRLSRGVTDMASHRDDVSVDGSLSSITDSQWDVVDEASAASEDEAGGIPRQSTPFSDPPERLNLDTGSLTGNDTGSDSPGLRSGRHLIEFNRSRKDSNSDPPDTARRMVPPRNFYKDPADFDFCREDQEHHIRFAENGASPKEQPDQFVSFHLTDFEDDERQDLINEYQLRDTTHLRGTLKQAMSRETLRLMGPFKILYSGSGGAKAAIVEKLGTALAAYLSTSTTSVMDSSRVTVVPVSAITENNAPDVVLIDSMGLDMNIEECTFAGSPRGGAFGSTMSLTINNQKSVESSWNPSSQSYEVSGGYQLPHLAVFYIADDESLSAQQIRARALSFLARHEVPFIVISASSRWTKRDDSDLIIPACPHLTLESVDMDDKEIRTLKRFPVDLNTFLSIDASQMNRNLTYITSSSLHGTRSAKRTLEARDSYHGSGRSGSTLGNGKAAISIKKIPIILLSLAWILFIFVMVHIYRGDLLSRRIVAPSVRSMATNVPSSIIATSTPQARPIPSGDKHLASLANRSGSSDLVALLMETKSMPNKSEKFKAQIVGDNHVVLRPPTWFNSLRKPPALHFKILRDQKEIQFEFSTLFDGVFTLKVPPEDAHGVLNISVWTVRRPRIDETFRIDFGNPWLKVKGWWKSAWAMADQVKGELSAAQENVSKAYRVANKHMEKAERAFKEVEKAGVGSLRLTTRTAQMLLESSKRLSRGISEVLSTKVQGQQQRLHQDITDYSKVMSTALLEQVEQMRKVAAGLDLFALRYKIQAYRERNFRQAQIRMLHAWWKFRGSSPPVNRVEESNCRRNGRCARQKASRPYPGRTAAPRA